MAEPAHLHQTHPEIVKRLKRIDGHLKGVIEMIETGRSCLDIAQQLHAIEKAGGTDRAKVRDALAGISGWQGVGGVFNFSKERHSGLSKDDLVLVNYRDGAFHLADYK